MPSKSTETLELDQYQKSDKSSFITYADLECLIEKIDGCKNNPETSSTTKAKTLLPPGFFYTEVKII